MIQFILPLFLVFHVAGRPDRTGWVDVYLRDAATKQPVLEGRYDSEVTIWVPDIPPRARTRERGSFSDGRLQFNCFYGYTHKVAISNAGGYCDSSFSFEMTRGKGVIQDWTVAKPKGGCPPEKKPIEYRVVHQAAAEGDH